jgi:NitT/TauT family transport system substrate-binding protein
MRSWRQMAACGLALAALGFAGCGGDDGGGGGGDGPQTVVVGTLPTANAAPMYLGMEKGYFKQEGLVVKPQLGEGGGSLITSLVSDDSQFAFVGVIPAVTAVSKGLPIKAVAASDDAAATPRKDWQVVMVGKGSDIRDVSDLEGKTIAVNALRGVAEVVIKTSLQKQGVDPSSVKLLEVPFPEMPAALKAGRVDAILASEPFLTGVLDAGGRQVDAPLSRGPSSRSASTWRPRSTSGRTATSSTGSAARWTSRPTTPPRTRTRCAGSSRRTRRFRRRWRRACACRRSTRSSTRRGSSSTPS